MSISSFVVSPCAKHGARVSARLVLAAGVSASGHRSAPARPSPELQLIVRATHKQHIWDPTLWEWIELIWERKACVRYILVVSLLLWPGIVSRCQWPRSPHRMRATDAQCWGLAGPETGLSLTVLWFRRGQSDGHRLARQRLLLIPGCRLEFSSVSEKLCCSGDRLTAVGGAPSHYRDHNSDAGK